MTLTLSRKKNALKDSGSMTESCQFPIAFTPMIYGSIFVEQQMCSRFDEERITSRGDEVRELFSMPNLYLCDSTDNPKSTVSGSAETSWHAFFNISGFLLSPYSLNNTYWSVLWNNRITKCVIFFEDYSKKQNKLNPWGYLQTHRHVRHFKNVKQISVGISPSIGASFEGSILGLYFVPAWLPNGTTSDVVILLMPLSQNLTKHILLSNVNHAKVNRFTN